MKNRYHIDAYNLVLDSPLGRLGIACRNQHIVRLDYLDRTVPLQAASTPFEREVAVQLARFFRQSRHRFTLPLQMQGTAFQCRVWDALGAIPPGETLTYGGLAAQLGSGARAVGNACRYNPISVIVPCHRVVAASGLGGYSGKTDGQQLSRKQWLLLHEGNTLQALKMARQTPNNNRHTHSQRTLHA